MVCRSRVEGRFNRGIREKDEKERWIATPPLAAREDVEEERRITAPPPAARDDGGETKPRIARKITGKNPWVATLSLAMTGRDG